MPLDRASGLRRDRATRGRAAAAHGPAAAVEERDRDAALPPQPRELDLRLRELPVRREEAAVLVRVRVAEHDLVHAALCADAAHRDRKSTRLNSSHRTISYAVFCLRKR